MEKSLYVVAVILVILWAIGFAGLTAGPMIHVLLVVAALTMLYNIFSERRMLRED